MILSAHNHSDGTVVIPDYLVEAESTITQLTNFGYTIDDPNSGW